MGWAGRGLVAALLAGCLVAFVSLAAAAQQQIVFGFKGSLAELEIAQEIVRRFNAAQDDIEVVILNMAGAGVSWPERLTTLFAGGAAPDVIRMEYQRSYPFIKEDLLLPLDEFIARDPSFHIDDFFPVAIEAHTVDGHVYGIPQEAQPFTVFVNTRRLDEAGLAFPPHDWDMDSFVEIARRTRVVDHESKVVHYGWQLETSLTRFAPFLYAFGADFVSPDRTAFAITSPQMIEALEYLQRAYLETGVIGGSFQAGQSTLYLGGPWMVPGFRDQLADVSWDIMPVPGGPGGRGTTLGSDAYHISKQSSSPELAWEFIKYITSEESLSLMAEGGSIVPARRDLAHHYITRASELPPHNLEAYLVGLEIARPTPMIRNFFDVARILEPAWLEVVQGKYDAARRMEEILPQLVGLLE